MKLIDRDAPHRSPAQCAFLVTCALDAYAEPVPPGKLGVEERDALAIEIGRKWSEREARGESSCAWHEIATHRGTPCRCYSCRPDIRRLA